MYSADGKLTPAFRVEAVAARVVERIVANVRRVSSGMMVALRMPIQSVFSMVLFSMRSPEPPAKMPLNRSRRSIAILHRVAGT